MVIEGADLKDKLSGAMGMSSDDVRTMGDVIKVLDDRFKEAAVGGQAFTNSLSMMLESMHRMRYSYTEFVSLMERSNVVIGSSVKLMNDLSMNIKGTTQSVEGLISAFSSLGGKTLPELIHYISMSSSSHAEEMSSIQAKREKQLESIKTTKESIALAGEELAKLNASNVAYKGKKERMEELNKALEDGKIKLEDEKRVLGSLNEELDEAKEKTKEFSEVLTKTVGWITLAVTAVIAASQAYDSAVKANREVIYEMGRLGISYGKNSDAVRQFNDSFTETANRWGMLREEMAKAVAPLTALGVGVGPGGAAASIDKIRETLVEAADLTGGMMRGFGIEAGITTKALGVLGTSLNLTGKDLSSVFLDIAGHGAKSALGMQRFITEMTSMLETTRRYGGAEEGSIRMLDAFGEQVKKGTLTMDNLVRMVAPAMWSPSQQGAVVTMLKQFAPEEAGKLGITKDMGLFNSMMKLQEAAGGKNAEQIGIGVSRVIDRIIPKGADEGTRAYMTQQLLQQLTGSQISLMKTAEVMSNPAKMSELLKPKTGKSAEDLMTDMLETYSETKTVQESLVGSVEGIRTFLLDTFGPKAGPGIQTGGGVTSGATAQAAGTAETVEKMKTLGMSYKGGPVDPFAGQYSKQTGGYISETGEYMLHAGEQVRRPGEGGGNVSVSLGGIHVSVGDRGSINSQLNEAFERVKRETIQEVERMYDESLTAH